MKNYRFAVDDRVEEREKYDASINAYRTQFAVMNNEREEGRKEGREEGFSDGMRQAAIRMKQMGLPDAVIINVTGLLSKEVSELQ